MAVVPSDDELRDLSVEDADELRAFLDKRRWFESRLTVLESVPPIFPFVRSNEGKDGSRERNEDAILVLPGADQIKAWQAERLALEEEVLAFDGGDLGRIKEKTRAVTLVPLTQPSTHLVSITLDLVVLVDRLLQLLRHRGELLELTALRIQWDAMRQQIVDETSKIRSEIAHIVREKAKWRPQAVLAGGSPARQSRRDSASNHGGHLETPSRPLATSSTSQSLASIANSPPKPTSASISERSHRRVSSVSLRDIASPAKTLPLIHSHIVNLEIRQKTLSTTLVTRSGKLLDKMIDVALPLKGLGGVHGPTAEDTGGAVPDEFLDIQDELEVEVEETTKIVSWSKALEEQWKRSDAHHSASLAAAAAAASVIEDLKEALATPASSAQHAKLEEALRSAQALIPPAIDETFPKPVHRHHPEVEQNTMETIATLENTRAQSSVALSSAEDGVRWYANLVKITDQVDQYTAKLQGTRADMDQTAASLNKEVVDPLHAQLADPSPLRKPGTDEQLSKWRSTADSHIGSIRTLASTLLETRQKATVVIMQYRQLAQAPPKSIISSMSGKAPMSPADNLEVLLDGVLETEQKCESKRKIAELDLRVALESRALFQLYNDLDRQLDYLDQNTPEGRGNADVLAGRLQDAQEKRNGLYATARGQWRDTLRQADGRHQHLERYLEDLRSKLDHKLSKAKEMVSLRRKIEEQEEAVKRIEEEAQGWIEKITQVQHTVTDESQAPRARLEHIASNESDLTMPDDRGTVNGHSKDAQVKHLEASVEIWLKAIPQQMVYLASSPVTVVNGRTPKSPSTSKGHQSASDTLGSTSLPTLSADQNSLTSSDDSARRRVNEASAKVSSAIYHLNQTLEKREREAKERSAAITALETRLEALHLRELAYPTAEEIQRSPLLLRLPTKAQVEALIAEVSKIAASSESIFAQTSTSQEDQAMGGITTAIDSAQSISPRLEALVTVTQRAEACEELQSQILDDLDGAADNDAIRRKLDAGETTIQALTSASSGLEDDRRVVKEVTRITHAWRDVRLIAERELNPGLEEDDTDDAASVVSSVAPSVVRSTSSVSRLPVSTSLRSINRSASNALPRQTTVLEPRNRAVSDTPARIRVGSTHDQSLPRSRQVSMRSTSSTGKANGTMSPPPLSPYTSSSLPRPKRVSQASNPFFTSPASGPTASSQSPSLRPTTPTAPVTRMGSINQSRRGSRLSTTPKPSTSGYIPNPKNKLDVAVGKIVNKLNVNVPIRPVGSDAKVDEWKDESGRYWIGAEGRAKLCFCRILRSRTVMVRVGGGWVELSKFLMDHFADTFTTWLPPPGAASMEGIGSDSPIPITSATLAANTPVKAYRSIPMSATRSVSRTTPAKSSYTTTPSRQSLPLPSGKPFDVVTPTKNYPESSVLSPSSPASPLVPLHFIKKASESPPMREKEKERLKAGRRSILGRSTSGSGLSKIEQE